jgi:HEAT repeat protein
MRPREDLSVRTQVAVTLGQYGPEAAEAVPALARAVNQSDVEVRLVVLGALERIGAAKAAAAVPDIAQALGDPSPRIRQEAARVLGRFGPAARDALPQLRKLLSDSDEDVRRAGSNAVLSINSVK